MVLIDGIFLITGFLNLGLKECSGNQGIKDIILSLKWIKENIHSFGGDPENITLLGSSSGAGIVNLLMLSPAARGERKFKFTYHCTVVAEEIFEKSTNLLYLFETGLFHKAVLMGAYVQNPVSPGRNTNEDQGLEVALLLGYQDYPKDRKKLLQFLKKQSPIPLLIQCRRCQKTIENVQPIRILLHICILFFKNNKVDDLFTDQCSHSTNFCFFANYRSSCHTRFAGKSKSIYDSNTNHDRILSK